MILFRADGNSSLGLGHVMRCLSIADAFSRHGEDSLFVTAGEELQKTIENRGFKCLSLGTEYNHLEGELNQLIEELRKRDVRALFVDSYYVTFRYLQLLSRVCARKRVTLVYIDDVLAFPYPCNVLLNYNIFANEDDYRKLYDGYPIPDFLLNTAYQPIRSEFQNLTDRVVKKKGQDILISTGGSDAEHFGIEIVKAIVSHVEWDGYCFHFVLGVMNSDSATIEKLVNMHENIVLHSQVKKMAELMRNCDVAVSAAGSTLYELCATQTPTLTYVLADNQISGANSFEKNGVLKSVGDIRVLGATELANRVLTAAVNLANNYEERVKIASRMKTVVDGNGANRIVKAVLKQKAKSSG